MKALDRPWLHHKSVETNGAAPAADDKPWKKPREAGAFATHAAALLLNGYSPVPILPKSKRPPDEGWNNLKNTPYTKDGIQAEARDRPALGLGVAGQYGGLVPIDIDTDDLEIIAAVQAVIPSPLVAKKGRKGYTAFYRAPDVGCVEGKKHRHKETGLPFVEILFSGQSVIPPTVHPDTHKPYEWLTAATLFDTPIGDLPQLAENFMADIENAVSPWLKKAEAVERSAPVPPSEISDARIRAYALDVLNKRAAELAGMGTESGRNNFLLATVLRCGSWVHHGVITQSELDGELYGAYVACGGMKDHGRHQYQATIKSGLRKSAGDELRTPESDKQPIVDAAGDASAKALIENYDKSNVIALPGVKEVPQADQKHKNALRLVPFHEIKLNTQPRYLVKGVLPSRGLGLVWGPPKQGKSFWTCDIAAHVAMGWQYRGRRVKKGIVIYCVLEGQSGFEARKAAMEQELLKGVDPREVPLFIMPVKMNLVAQRGELIKLIREELGDDVPAMVVVDTLNRSFEGSESDDESMTRYIKAADEITDTFDCLTLVVHHSGWDTSRARGHSALIGAIDVEISVKKSEDGKQVVSRVECMKDGQDGAEFSSELDAVIVGKDDDGDDIVSCVIKPVEAAQEAPRDPNKDPRKRVTAPANKIALEALQDAIASSGVLIEHQPEIPDDLPCVTVDEWRSLCFSRGISKGASESSARVAFHGARQWLQANKYIGFFEGRAWLEPNPNDLSILASRIVGLKER
mgnify:CR=1 FL=1